MLCPQLCCFSGCSSGLPANRPSESTESQGKQQEQHQRSCAPLEKVGQGGEAGTGGWQQSPQRQHTQEHACGSDALSLCSGPPGSYRAKAPTSPAESPGLSFPGHRGGPAMPWTPVKPSLAAAEPSHLCLLKRSSSLLCGERCSLYSSTEHMVRSCDHKETLS